MVSFLHYILLSSLFLSQLACPVASVQVPRLPPACSRTCGSHEVPYPFGFSPGCQIRLNCSRAGEMQLGGYGINRVTPESIFVDVPFVCDRPVDAVRAFFGRNYAMTSGNFFLLRNCSSSDANIKSDCQISTQVLYNRLMSKNGTRCRAGDDVRCFPPGGNDHEMVLKEEVVVNRSRVCKHLSTTFRYGSTVSGEQSLVFGSAELAWWMGGKSCKCSPNANYVPVVVPGQEGCKCTCLKGFSGDGFIDGQGCLKEKCDGVGEYMSANCKSSIRVGLLVGGLIAAASLIFLSACLCHLVRRRYLHFRTHKVIQRLVSKRLMSAVPIYSYQDIQFATNNFAESHALGTGAYGTVYLGRFPGDKLVAIKRLRHRGSFDNLNQVANEIRLISSVSHPNLVRLLGCCIDKDAQILVYEFVPNGTLGQHLRRERGDGLPWPTRVAISADTAKAIAYLHNSVHPPIYHRDIKSSNILLDDELKPKLADFGLSRTGMTELSHISTAPQGTPGYVDPLYHQEFHLSDKSDVYSFGVVLVEMMTAMKVVDFDRAPREVNLASLAVDRIGNGKLEEIVDPLVLVAVVGGDDGWTTASIHKVAELAFRCLAFDKDARPSMAEVAEELEKIRAQVFEAMARDGEWNDVAAGACPKSATHVLGIPAEVVPISPVSVQEQWVSDSESSSSSSSVSLTLSNVQHC